MYTRDNFTLQKEVPHRGNLFRNISHRNISLSQHWAWDNLNDQYHKYAQANNFSQLDLFLMLALSDYRLSLDGSLEWL